MTGHRVVEQILRRFPQARVVATSRLVENGLPAGPLGPTVHSNAREWGTRVKWAALDLSADAPKLAAMLEQLENQPLPVQLPDGLSGGQLGGCWLVFAAAYTNVEGCEENPDFCKTVNIDNTIAVLDWAKERGMKIAFYSTDYVFDGRSGPYVEDAAYSAESVYGQAKVTVEKWLTSNAADSLILRTTGVYDWLSGSKNFLMQLVDAAEKGASMRVPSDQLANPIWAYELATATVDLLASHQQGVFHVAGDQVMARSDFAQLILEVLRSKGRPFGVKLAAVLTQSLGQKAKRPLKGGLKTDKLRQALGWAPRGPGEVLTEIIA